MSHPQLSPGQFWWRWIDDTQEYVIDRADPVIEWTGSSLDLLRAGTMTTRHAQVHDDLITFRGANRAVIYRICEHDPERDVWTLRWPD